MRVLQKDFENRESLVAYVKALTPWANGCASHIQGGREIAETVLTKIDPVTYARTRNYALTQCSEPLQIRKFIQELAWRDF